MAPAEPEELGRGKTRRRAPDRYQALTLSADAHPGSCVAWVDWCDNVAMMLESLRTNGVLPLIAASGDARAVEPVVCPVPATLVT